MTLPPPRPARIRGVIFDGDDTLWLTETLYDEARSKARDIVAGVGLDGERWESVQLSRDVANVAAFGHSTQRFPTSCVEAFDIVAGTARPHLARARSQVWDAAAEVFALAAPLREGATAALACLVDSGVRLALLTKGDERVQLRRIEQSGLEGFFDVVRVVEAKAAVTFASTAASLGLSAEEVISVGNSVESDIRPSQDAGIFAVWLPAYVWDYERRHDPAVEADLHRIQYLSEVAEMVVARTS